MAQQAPPLYGEHQFDILYSELDPHGYRTPGIYSGVATPLYGSISRNLSAENLSSLATLDTGGDVAANILHNRLVDLHIDSSSLRSPGTPPPELLLPDAHDNRRSMTFPITTFTAATTPDISRRTSEDEHLPSGLISPHFIRTNDVEDLSRVPSYSTAVRSCACPPITTAFQITKLPLQAMFRRSVSGHLRLQDIQPVHLTGYPPLLLMLSPSFLFTDTVPATITTLSDECAFSRLDQHNPPVNILFIIFLIFLSSLYLIHDLDDLFWDA